MRIHVEYCDGAMIIVWEDAMVWRASEASA